MPDQCYSDGDFWQCLVAGDSPNQGPLTHPSRWAKIRIPKEWRRVLGRLTYALLLDSDRQADKASIERARATAWLDELVRQAARQEQTRGRSSYQAPGQLQTVKASVILEDAERLMQWDLTQLDDREQDEARNALSQALQQVWEAWWWPQLMLCAQSQFLPTADPDMMEPWGQGNKVYWPITDWYYYAYMDDFSRDPSDTAGETQTGWWKMEVDARPGTWTPDSATAAGALVRWLNYNWLCVTANTGVEPANNSGYWAVLPDWHPELPYTDGWTLLASGPFGPIRMVSRLDPRTTDNPGPFELAAVPEGTRVLQLDIGRPWVWSRRVTPVLTGEAFDGDVLYSATPLAEQVFTS